MAIDLVLSDDWELRGDGSGDMRILQFGTARRLMDLYEQYGLRGTFNVEVMQQLGHRQWSDRFPHLAPLAAEWDDCVREMHQRGHDVQLHVHPQWWNAHYDGRQWQLQPNWSIVEFPEADVRQMLFDCRDYLQGLIRQDDPGYRCRSFRSGSWSLAPSPFMLSILAEIGITFDMSMGQGLFYDLPMVRLDYRRLEEPFFPYYPQIDDARRVSAERQPIVCIPTHSRKTRLPPHLRRVWEMAIKPLLKRAPLPAAHAYLLTPSALAVAGDASAAAYGGRWSSPESKLQAVARLCREMALGKDFVTDMSLLGYYDYRACLDHALRRSRKAGESRTPVIFENHTKNVGNFAPIEQFCRLLARRPEVRVVTAAEVADGIEQGVYPIRSRSQQQAERSPGESMKRRAA